MIIQLASKSKLFAYCYSEPILASCLKYLGSQLIPNIATCEGYLMLQMELIRNYDEDGVSDKPSK